MFGTTFLGHQGWLFRTERACIAVDPLLCEQFGAQHALDYQVYPPRRLDLARFPALDAVVLTHEHDDHFDIPSLAKLSRKIPIHLSARSSSAAHGILREMGFGVVSLEPGVPMTFGDLEVIPMAGDHVSVDCGDEWDTLPLLVRDAGGAGSFFSMVDVTPTERHLLLVKGVVGKPGLVTSTNNALDWSHMTDFADTMVGSTEACAARMVRGRDLVRALWGRPAAMLLCAGGFSFHGERAWLNRRVFPMDCDRACATLRRSYPREKFVSTLPMQTFWMERNRLVRVDASTEFLVTAPRDAWPVREPARLETLPDFEPASGARALGRGELARLARGLDELAAALVGGPLFRCLHSMMAGESEGRRPTFAFALRDGERRHVFEYVPSACTFRRVVVDDAESAYLLGLECWATDLLRVLRGDFGPNALTFDRARLWNAAPDVVADTISDLHFGSRSSGGSLRPVLLDAIREMNAIEGKPYPCAIGGRVRAVRGVLVAGDLTEDGRPAEWTEFVETMGLRSEGALRHPVFESYGNHDEHSGRVVRAGVIRRLDREAVLAFFSDVGDRAAEGLKKVSDSKPKSRLAYAEALARATPTAMSLNADLMRPLDLRDRCGPTGPQLGRSCSTRMVALRSTTRAASERSVRSSWGVRTGSSTAATTTRRAPRRSSPSSAPADSTASTPTPISPTCSGSCPTGPRTA